MDSKGIVDGEGHHQIRTLHNAVRIIRQRNSAMHSSESIHHGRSFVPRNTDTFIATYPKCGTTWVSAITHALRTRADRIHQDFDEITEVVPWDILALDCGQNLNFDQVATPRLFKSHETWNNIAKGGRYIYVLRNPEDAFLSFFYFLPKYLHVHIDIETFAEEIFCGLSHSKSIWKHYVGWIEAARKDPERILLITFEDLKRDSRKEIQRIANFMNQPLNETLLNQVLELSCIDYMSQNMNQFDDHFVYNHLKKRMGLKGPHLASKVRSGGVGNGKIEIPDNIMRKLDHNWEKIVQKELGAVSYQDLVEAFVYRDNHMHHNCMSSAKSINDLSAKIFPADPVLKQSATEWAWKQASDPRARSLGSKQLDLPSSITRTGLGAEQAFDLFQSHIEPTLRSNGHPRNLGYVGNAATPASIAFDWMISAACQNAPVNAAAPGLIEAERQALKWIADLAGFPSTAGGTFVSGATAGNLSALHAAFQHKLKSRPKNLAVCDKDPKIVVGSSAHSSIKLAAKVMRVEILQTSGDKDQILTGKAVEEKLRDERGVFAVVCTAGATNSGAIDELDSIASVCREYGVWLHVDGAYGLASLAASSKRHLFNGIEYADSLVIDPHKMLFAPYDSCALLYRNRRAARNALILDASYLATVEHHDEVLNPCEMAIHLSRRPRGATLWFSLTVYGTDRYEMAIEKVYETTNQITDFVRNVSYLKLVIEPILTVILFQKPDMSRNEMQAWCKERWHSGQLFCSITTYKERDCFRLCVVNPATCAEDVIEALKTLQISGNY